MTEPLRKMTDTRKITLRFRDGVEKTYTVGGSTSKNDVVAWARRIYPDAEALAVVVGICIRGQQWWEWEKE